MSGLTDLSEILFLNPSQISKHLECAVCSVYFTDPFRLNCGHTFCRLCIEGVKKAVKPFQQLMCPSCREIIDIRYVSSDLIANNLISEQIVFCFNKSKYCGWKGPLYSLDEHLQNCAFKEHDTASQQLFEKFDQGVKQTLEASDLNTTSFNTTLIDEKLQENINKNVGESLLVRLMNKDKTMAQNIAKQMSTAERIDSKFKQSSFKQPISISDDRTRQFAEMEEDMQDSDDKNNKNNNNYDDDIMNLFSDEETDQGNNNSKPESDEKTKTIKVSRSKRSSSKKVVSLPKQQSTLNQTKNSQDNLKDEENSTLNISSNVSKGNKKQVQTRQVGKKRMMKKDLPALDAIQPQQFHQFISNEDEEGII